MLGEEKLNELCAKELLELDRHTYGYATAGKDINAVLDRYVIAYKSGYRQAEEEAVELLDNSHRALILIEDTYSILLNNGSPKITQEMEQISEAIDLLKQTLAKRRRCCV